MIDPQKEDPQTECQVFVEDWYAPAINKPGQYGPAKREFVNTIGFSYSSDVLNLGDPFSFTIANPEGRYNGRFQRGARVEFYLSNPSVRGGKLTLKHTGIVVNRTQRGDVSGCFLDVQCADLGWHLRENDAPLWFKLQGGKLDTLIQNPKWIDPSWGIKGLLTDNQGSIAIRQALNNGRAQAQIDQQPFGTFVYIQVEPGDRVADILINYARREGVLLTVSPDGFIQVWNPAEAKKALYAIELHAFSDQKKTTNTVITYSITEDISTIYTDVTCIGEIVGGDIQADSLNQNASKRRASVVNADVLPFRHRVNYADGDVYSSDIASKAAAWRYNRGIFDSWSATYTVRGHHCNGNWWESDTYVTIHDSINGLDGDFYIQSVQYNRSDRGDITTITARKPGLLKASFGRYPRTPKLPMPLWLIEQIQRSQTTQRATKVNR